MARGQQLFRIIMFGVRKNSFALPFFNKFTGTHHYHPVAYAGNYPKIMAYKQIGEIFSFLQLYQEVQDLRLDRYIKA